MYQGVLIEQSVDNANEILSSAKIVGQRSGHLEGENFRGDVTFYNIEVKADNVDELLNKVSASIKSPGWFFHLVDGKTLYVVMPNRIMKASKNEQELELIVDYAISHGIHSEQLDLMRHFEKPFV